MFAVHLAVAAAGSMVLVNTVTYVRDVLGRDETAVALALAANGLGSLTAAIALPRLLDRARDRTVMPRAGAVLAAALFLTIPSTTLPGAVRWPTLLALWAIIGAGSALVLTPAGRLLRRFAHPGDLPALFAADFSLSHACWLACYPLADWLATQTSIPATLAVLGALTIAATTMATRTWSAEDPEAIEHDQHDLDEDHEHLAEAVPIDGGRRHIHQYRIDELHTRWPAA